MKIASSDDIDSNDTLDDCLFQSLDATALNAVDKKFLGCKFKGIRFSGAKIAGSSFEDCEFESCDLSLLGFDGVTLVDSGFVRCKMLGTHWGGVRRPFRATFRDCNLSDATFFGVNAYGIEFNSCKLSGVDFRSCSLRHAVFENCTLDRALFQETDLTDANLTGAYDISLNPNTNKLCRTKFSVNNVLGLLDLYDIEIQ